MPLYVTDTHALLWYLADSHRLGPVARRSFDEAKAGRAVVIVPAIVLAELIWIVQKASLAAALDRMVATICKHYLLTPLEPADVLRLPDLALIPEMHDRLIVAETQRRQAMLITRDEAITRSGLVAVLW